MTDEERQDPFGTIKDGGKQSGIYRMRLKAKTVRILMECMWLAKYSGRERKGAGIDPVMRAACIHYRNYLQTVLGPNKTELAMAQLRRDNPKYNGRPIYAGPSREEEPQKRRRESYDPKPRPRVDSVPGA